MGDKTPDGQHTDKAVDTVSEKATWTKDKIDKALTLDPKFADAYMRLATIYQSEGMYDETVAILNEGLAVVPDDEILLMMRRGAENCRDRDEAGV